MKWKMEKILGKTLLFHVGISELEITIKSCIQEGGVFLGRSGNLSQQMLQSATKSNLNAFCRCNIFPTVENQVYQINKKNVQKEQSSDDPGQ